MEKALTALLILYYRGREIMGDQLFLGLNATEVPQCCKVFGTNTHVKRGEALQSRA
jgi:hypothetical protein